MKITLSRWNPELAAAALLLSAACLPAAEKVIAFRNGGTGAWPDADPPLEWSATKNVRWRWDGSVLGTTIATPILVGKRVITLARPMTIVALDKDTGKELWRRERYDGQLAAAGEYAGKMHAALLRDGRIHYLLSILGQKGGTRLGHITGRGSRKGLRGKTAKLPDDDKAYFEGRVAAVEALLADGEANRATYEKELADLQATVPEGKNAIRAGGRTSASTPASDGERIFAIFAPGLLVCCDLAGKPLWTHAMIGENGRQARQQWNAFAEVPLCADGPSSPDGSAAASKVLCTWGNLLHCLDAATGKVLWQRVMTGNHCAASPALGTAGGVTYFMHCSGEVARLDDGKTLFTAAWGGKHRYWATAVDADRRTFHYVRGAVRLPADPGGKPVQLWEQPEERQKNKERDDWIIEGGHSYCAPVVHDGIVYFYETCGGRSSALDAETGKLIYGPIMKPDDGKALVLNGHKADASYADLSLAGEHLIMFSVAGDSVVLKVGREFGIVRRNPMIGKVVSNNPIFEGKRMYARTRWSLFCFEKGG